VSPLLIVTDMDGTLLDHETYDYTAASEALDAIRRRGIPLVLASSKSRAEMQVWQAELGLDAPFICENGAAICTPTPEGLDVESLACPRNEVLAVLSELRDAHGYRFTGFSDSSIAGIVELTGLDFESAARAAHREYSEPLRWEDGETRLAGFIDLLAQRGLRAQQGGRFLSVAGPADKGLAVTRLRLRYETSRLIVLGDSPNDEPMLAVADVAVIIKSARSEEIRLTAPRNVIRTALGGPAGWQAAVQALLREDG
jgi:mannosyl-3-phosphoglycerate phosphatase